MTIGALLAPAGMFWLSRVSENSHYLTGVGLPLIVFAAAAGPGSPVYDHALSSGVTTALTMGAGATVLALIVTLIAIRIRREDLPDSPLVM